MDIWIETASNWLWGPPMLALFLGTGVYLFFRLRVVQVHEFLAAVRSVLPASKDKTDGDISPFAALMTSVGGIVGNGNIAGVATAITAGGPGALFWMWISGVLGMATMFVESVLGIRYRARGKDGLFVGGPMYYLRDRLNWSTVATFFAFGMVVKTVLATTTVQSNSIASVVEAQLGWNPFFSCLVVASITAIAILGGVRSVGLVSEFLCPFMGILYLAGSLAVLMVFVDRIPSIMLLIYKHAFSPIAAMGGFLGASVQQAFRFGVARGVYSNEAGVGSAPIAHASARTQDAIKQGKIAMLGVFLDTLIISNATGLVLLASGVWTSGVDSTALAAMAFANGIGEIGGYIVLVASVLFGISTLISWAFFGEQAAVYLWGIECRRLFRLGYCVAILGGSLGESRTIWALGDLLNGILAIPNLIAILVLTEEIARKLQENKQI